jgi:cellulose synthase/poly-beta-1,6-N-acetylglucosamine synthase-like glycosyltransferase
MEPNASSLVAYRWSADAYALARSPEEAAGLLGRNAAVTRRALERAGGLAADVPTGTDYHLAKCLLERGVRIRHVRESWVTTRYPENLRAYARQQRRWLKNVVVLGRRFGAYREMAAAARTSVIGLGMLLTPALVWLVGGWILSLWLVAVAHSAVSKVRYLAFASLLNERFDRRLLFRSVWWVIPLTFVEFGIWASALADYLIPRRRTLW